MDRGARRYVRYREGGADGGGVLDSDRLAGAGAGRSLVLGVAAVGGLPVEGAGLAHGDVVGVGDDGVGDHLGAAAGEGGGAGVVAVDGVGDGAAGGGGGVAEGR